MAGTEIDPNTQPNTHQKTKTYQNYRIPVVGEGVPDVLTSGADGSDGAVRAGVERDAGGEVTGAGYVAAGVVLGAGDAVDAVVNHAVDGMDVETAVCASEGGTVRPVRPNYCLWC